jgi:hypothetical protein
VSTTFLVPDISGTVSHFSVELVNTLTRKDLNSTFLQSSSLAIIVASLVGLWWKRNIVHVIPPGPPGYSDSFAEF